MALWSGFWAGLSEAAHFCSVRCGLGQEDPAWPRPCIRCPGRVASMHGSGQMTNLCLLVMLASLTPVSGTPFSPHGISAPGSTFPCGQPGLPHMVAVFPSGNSRCYRAGLVCAQSVTSITFHCANPGFQVGEKQTPLLRVWIQGGLAHQGPFVTVSHRDTAGTQRLSGSSSLPP